MKRIIKIEENKTISVKKKTRVAAYCRVSTASDEQLISLDTQKAHYEDYIKSNCEWEYAGVFYDEGITGTKKGVP
ncbi:DNA invertase Pin-like site-specific DNA recombinase [Aequitasia blattaphilus]|uniref:recombinase family protein n=1 Tax=Aequitasia blattaphilus TaxID=2949332 RepID=UPI002ED3651F